MRTLEELECWLNRPIDEDEARWIEQARIDDKIIEYAEYLVEEYGQSQSEALDNAMATGYSTISKNHPHFSGE